LVWDEAEAGRSKERRSKAALLLPRVDNETRTFCWSLERMIAHRMNWNCRLAHGVAIPCSFCSLINSGTDTLAIFGVTHRRADISALIEFFFQFANCQRNFNRLLVDSFGNGIACRRSQARRICGRSILSDPNKPGDRRWIPSETLDGFADGNAAYVFRVHFQLSG